MKLLLDQGTPRSAAALLRQAGLDALHTGECGLSEASDADIMQQAANHGRTMVTLDADFHPLLALNAARKPSVIRLRIEGLRAEHFSELLQRVLRQCAEELADGALISVTEAQIRIRRLPIG